MPMVPLKGMIFFSCCLYSQEEPVQIAARVEEG